MVLMHSFLTVNGLSLGISLCSVYAMSQAQPYFTLNWGITNKGPPPPTRPHLLQQGSTFSNKAPPPFQSFTNISTNWGSSI